MIILVGGEKGGPGKSTVAQNLAVYFASIQGKDVMLIDADPQATTNDWADERSKAIKKGKDLVKISSCQKLGDIGDTLEDFSSRYEVVVIDTAGVDTESLRAGMVLADICIFPFRPKRRDLKTLPRIEQIVKLAKAQNKQCKYLSVITQCPSGKNQQYRIDDTKSSVEAYGLAPLRAVTENRNSYDDCDEGGLTVLEYTDKKAKDEIMAIGHELMGLING